MQRRVYTPAAPPPHLRRWVAAALALPVPDRCVGSPAGLFAFAKQPAALTTPCVQHSHVCHMTVAFSSPWRTSVSLRPVTGSRDGFVGGVGGQPLATCSWGVAIARWLERHMDEWMCHTWCIRAASCADRDGTRRCRLAILKRVRLLILQSACAFGSFAPLLPPRIGSQMTFGSCKTVRCCWCCRCVMPAASAPYSRPFFPVDCTRAAHQTDCPFEMVRRVPRLLIAQTSFQQTAHESRP